MLHIQTKELLLLHLSLNRITFLRFDEKKLLSKKLDSYYSLALLSIEEISQIVHRPFSKRVVWNGKENLHQAEVALHYCELLNIRILLYDDEEYSELLRQIPDPPYLLFCRGDVSILNKPSVSVVGTRKLSQLGKTSARQFAYDAVLNGCNVISGLANGADGYAHQGAVDAFFDASEKNLDLSALGRTIAVIPSSIDQILPASHKRLASLILQTGGCIISEYEPALGMANWHFVGRNRIIAGLSQATVVIEAPCGSGALITADFAVDYNRDVMFHASCFMEGAKGISEFVAKELEIKHAAGQAANYKIENTVSKFLDAGAKVIKDYNDFCRVLMEPPGIKDIPLQGELF